MKISMQTADESIQHLRTEIEQLTEAFERKNGPVKTSDIIIRGQERSRWNGTLIAQTPPTKSEVQSRVNQQIAQRYATEPCLKELAKELGISLNSLSKRSARMGISRNETVTTENHPSSLRAAQRLSATAELLAAGKPVEVIAGKLDISPRLVRKYRKDLESVQEAA